MSIFSNNSRFIDNICLIDTTPPDAPDDIDPVDIEDEEEILSLESETDWDEVYEQVADILMAENMLWTATSPDVIAWANRVANQPRCHIVDGILATYR